MNELLSFPLLIATLAFVLVDLAINPEPVLVLRRAGPGEGRFSQFGRQAIGWLIQLAARLAFGALLFWLATRTDTLMTWGDTPISLATIVMVAAGALLLIRALSEILTLSYRRFASDGVAQLAPTSVMTAAIVAAVEPSVLALGLVDTLVATLACLALGAVLLILLARPMARAINRFPHIRLLGLAAVAIIGGALILTAPGGTYPRFAIVVVTLGLAIVAIVATVLAARSGASPSFEVIPDALVARPGEARADELREPRFADEDGDDGDDEPRLIAPTASRVRVEPAATSAAADVVIMPPPPRDPMLTGPNAETRDVEPIIAAAIASQSDNVPEPVIDSNIDEEVAEDQMIEPLDETPPVGVLESQGFDEAPAIIVADDADTDADMIVPERDPEGEHISEIAVEDVSDIAVADSEMLIELADADLYDDEDEPVFDDDPTPESASDVTLDADDRPIAQRLRDRERQRPLRGPARRRQARREKGRR